MIYLDKIADQIKEMGIPSKGSTTKEIEEVQSSLRVELPIVYKEFLQIFGKKSDVVFCGDTVTTRHIDFIQEEGRRTYYKALKKECPKNILFILEHQVYSFYYFLLDGTENPDLFLLLHGDEITNEKKGKLTDLVKLKISLISKRYET